VGGGNSGTGGQGGTGTGGTGSPTGGTPSTGGTGFPTGGTPSTGGTGLPTGGTPSTGGTGFPTGGTPSTGGTFPTGGTPSTGGTGTPTGGAGGSGGGGGMGPAVCGSTFMVTDDGFMLAPGASGSCWHGYAFAGGDTGSTVAPTTFGMCGAGCMLRTSGTVGPATATNMYSGVVYLGVNINQDAGSSTFTPIAPVGSSLVVAFTKAAGPATIRVQIQAGSSRWCANLTTSPATIPYIMFNTQCWDMMGTAYAKQPIEAVQLVIPGPDAAAGVAFDMTLVSIRDM
jgi:hypothetical protein